MQYIHRQLERKFLNMDNFFKAVLVTGARQVGKTTMLQHLGESQNRNYVSLDNLAARDLAQRDPEVFFQRYPPPVIIDEVQYAPELFVQIKIMCDASEDTGQFWLTGSQQFALMKNIRETLAGRIGILEMYGLSQSEKYGILHENDLDFSMQGLIKRQALTPKNNIVDVFEHIWRGGLPQVQKADAEQRQTYFETYVDTYLMRDVAELGGVTDSLRFSRFLTACAALAGEQLNYKTLADASEISQPTAKEWTRLLQGMGIIFLLQPFMNNELKRLTKTPKLYFTDTGLCAHLSSWLTVVTLMDGAASGRYFENYVVAELVKQYAYAKKQANLSYYRDSNAKEIDIFVESDNMIHPLEIKKSAAPDRREVKKFSVLDKTNLTRGPGGIICLCSDVVPIDTESCYIPSNII